MLTAELRAIFETSTKRISWKEGSILHAYGSYLAADHYVGLFEIAALETELLAIFVPRGARELQRHSSRSTTAVLLST